MLNDMLAGFMQGRQMRQGQGIAEGEPPPGGGLPGRQPRGGGRGPMGIPIPPWAEGPWGGQRGPLPQPGPGLPDIPNDFPMPRDPLPRHTGLPNIPNDFPPPNKIPQPMPPDIMPGPSRPPVRKQPGTSPSPYPSNIKPGY